MLRLLGLVSLAVALSLAGCATVSPSAGPLATTSPTPPPPSPPEPETWPAPLIPRRADPHVFRDADGTYYFTATVPEYDRIELRAAPTLASLANAPAKTIWRKHASGVMGAHIWAPEIHRIDGKWYVYFSAGRAEAKWRIRLWVLENASADPLQGEWIEKGRIRTHLDSFALDGTTFEHAGVRYFAWAQKDPAIRGNSNLYLSAMENPWTLRGRPVLLASPDLPWERRGRLAVVEAPAVIRRNGRVFMTYSAAATDATYCLGLLSAPDTADLLDPSSWTKSPEPVFKTSEANRQFGPGHNSFTTSAEGRDDVLVYHARNYRDIVGDALQNPDRHARAQKFTWAPDGTPVFGEPVPDPVAMLPDGSASVSP